MQTMANCYANSNTGENCWQVKLKQIQMQNVPTGMTNINNSISTHGF